MLIYSRSLVKQVLTSFIYHCEHFIPDGVTDDTREEVNIAVFMHRSLLVPFS